MDKSKKYGIGSSRRNMWIPFWVIFEVLGIMAVVGLASSFENGPIPPEPLSETPSATTSQDAGGAQAVVEREVVDDLFGRQAAGVSCLLAGNCQDAVPQRTRACIQGVNSKEWSRLSVIGDACGVPKKRRVEQGGFLRNIFRFLGRLPGLLNVEFSLFDDVAITVVYAPVSDPETKAIELVPVTIARFSEVVYFDFNKTEMNAPGYSVIQSLVKELKEGGLAQNRVTIVGHADNVGTRSANLTLSKGRADEVESALMRHAELFKIDLITEPIGVGEVQPVQYFKEQTRSQLNRRVEFFFSTSAAANDSVVEYVGCIHRHREDPEICYARFLAL